MKQSNPSNDLDFLSRKFSIQQKVVTATIGVSKRVLPDLVIQGQRIIHERNIHGQQKVSKASITTATDNWKAYSA